MSAGGSSNIGCSKQGGVCGCGGGHCGNDAELNKCKCEGCMRQAASIFEEDRTGLCTVRDCVSLMKSYNMKQNELVFKLDGEKVNVMVSIIGDSVANGVAELPPLPSRHVPMVGWTLTEAYQKGWLDKQAAIAASTQQAAQKIMLTDEKIFKLYQESHVEYDATVLVRNQFTEENEYQTQKQSCFSPLKFADAICAAVVITKGE